MNIVIIGHVDHGKSTLVGRLLADTGSLPQGKLDAVREQCRRNAKPFEYAFLLDALKDEQAQGITIDSARCFFHTPKREYIIFDAPGHVEFLKNMISGAARAEAGLLLIDAKEGVQENSRRHGYLMSMLGIRQIAVCINKMDLVDYRREAFESIRDEYTRFLHRVGIAPRYVIPIAARPGDNIMTGSSHMPWYDGPTALQAIDGFEKEASPRDKPLRFPVQDIYKFTEADDERRIVAGRVATGSVAVGDEVVFLPSGKRTRIASVEAFHAPQHSQAEAGQSAGFTLEQQIYIRPGELMCKASEPAPRVTTRLRVNLFWLGRQPMIMGKRYKLKLGSARVPAWLTEIKAVMDASRLTSVGNRRQVERHDVAECVIETLKPIACDIATELPTTGRFVIIDNYEIAGGGVILEPLPQEDTLIREQIRRREQAWDRSRISPQTRAARFGQRPALILLCGPVGQKKQELARAVEEHLFKQGKLPFYLGISNQLLSLDVASGSSDRDEYLRRLGEVAHLFGSAGTIVIAAVSDLDDYELAMIEKLNQPNDLLVVSIGAPPDNRLEKRRPDLAIGSEPDMATALKQIETLLQSKSYLVEYEL
jgi:bifunctional enzyme CysN/CysC